jgi:hypothetical protein
VGANVQGARIASLVVADQLAECLPGLAGEVRASRRIVAEKADGEVVIVRLRRSVRGGSDPVAAAHEDVPVLTKQV